MVLPEISNVCDSIELAAINHFARLSLADLETIFFPGDGGAMLSNESSSEIILREALDLAERRCQACAGEYPFEVTDRSISFNRPTTINCYLFLLLGRSLNLGVPDGCADLRGDFRKYFEDVTSWALGNAGFKTEILSVPREFRGMPKGLKPALRQLSQRFNAKAELDETRVLPVDNDLDVDIIAVPIVGNGGRCGWPVVMIQCATGAVDSLQSKMEEGCNTFSGVWRSGFNRSTSIRSLATPYDLLLLNDVYWNRLSDAGWILDRTRISYMCSFENKKNLPDEVMDFWNNLWNSKDLIDWQNSMPLS
jgi:hypothetical protein